VIRITRPAQSPAILQTRGAAEQARICAEYDRDQTPYRLGTQPQFDRSIYADSTVKDELLRVQHGKCAFCESKVTHIAYGDVEHYRPKAGYVQRPGDSLKRPGYFWLAYAWTNLVFSCQLCNQRFKRNHFPLLNHRRRIRSHRSPVTSEEPVFIDPAAEDPELHITFRDEVAFPFNGSPRGQATIDALGLNRPELVEFRKSYLVILREYRDARDALRAKQQAGSLSSHDQRLLAVMDARLAALMQADAQYAAMTRALLR